MAFDPDKNQFFPASAIEDLPADGSSTVTELEEKVNEVIAALRAAGVIDPD